MSEAGLRAHMAQWFALGETLGFAAQPGCVAGAFRLIDTQMGSALPVVQSVPRAVQMVQDRGAVALDRAGLPPDQALVDIVNVSRSLGIKMRRAGLEGRACMDDVVESAFRYALENPAAVLGFDRDLGALMLMDPDTSVLIVAIGGET